MLKWLKLNYPVVVLLLIVFSMPFWIMHGVRVDRIYRYDLKVDQCENVVIPTSISRSNHEAYCRCVTKAREQQQNNQHCEFLIQKLYQSN